MKPVNETIPFKGTRIHVIYDGSKAVKWISLHDLCRILCRQEMIGNGQAAGICRSAAKFPVYKNGKLFPFIKIYDIYTLTRSIEKENKQIARICRELEEWAGKLPVNRDLDSEPKPKQEPEPKPEPEPVPSPGIRETATVIHAAVNKAPEQNNTPVIFSYHDQPISFQAPNGVIYVNATEMARSQDKNPREWLLLAETQRFRQSLVDNGISHSLESQITTKRGSVGATWIQDSLAFKFAEWLSPDLSVWMNERIKDLLKQGYVTLGQSNIRFETAYGAQRQLPSNFREACRMLIEQEEVIEAKTRQIETDRPKVQFYQKMVGDRESFKTSFIAEELQISTIELHRFLIEERICKFEKRQYVAYPSHAALQCDHPYYWTNKKGKAYVCSVGKRWTKAGREFILDLYREKDPGNK
ncbi:KilA-N domain-containing protein [Dysgonomonas termitidis]|uniref:KilA-N domain-containing protein n=1 Tax=Dysgonomonas termitidis TaxID=1516126 RepID=A0ABV9KRE4_9BACT